MNILEAITAALSLSLLAACAGERNRAMTDSTHPHLELALYSTSSPAFDAAQRRAHRDLRTYPGFVASLALRGLDDPASRADLVVWASEADALAAAKTVGGDERFAEFTSAIAEIRHFAHYPVPSGARALDGAAGQPLIEIAVFGAKPELDLGELQAAVHRALADVDGAAPLLRSHRITDPATHLDVIGWATRDAHARAPEILLARHPELGAFFDGVGTPEVLALFEVVE